MFPQACESRFKRLCYCCLSLVRLPHTLRELVGHVPAGLKSVEARVFLMAWSPCGLLVLCELLGYVPAGLVIQIGPGLFLWLLFLKELSALCELIAGTFLLAFENQFVQVCSCDTVVQTPRTRLHKPWSWDRARLGPHARAKLETYLF